MNARGTALFLSSLLLLGACASDSSAGSDGADGSDATAASDTGAADASDGLADPDLAEATDAAETADNDSGPGEPVHRVGFRTGSHTYSPADGSADRTLRVAYWYPTDDTTGDEVRYLTFIPAPGVLGGAAPRGGPAPVVVFSHGNTAYAEQSAFFSEFLASRGFLVVAPDHTGNTVGQPLDVGIFQWRPADISAVIDHLEALPGDEPLAKLMSDKIAVAGHSFGGYTALAVGGAAWDVDAMLAYCEAGAIELGGCESLVASEAIYREGFLDPRVDAVISMAPGIVLVFGGGGIAQMPLPTMLVTGSRDKRTPNATNGDLAWTQLAGSSDNLRLDFASAGHFSFSDACTLPVSIGVGDGCGEGFIDSARVHAAVNAFALAFLRLHLLGDAAGQPLLSGAESIEPDLTLSLGRAP